MLLSAMAAVRLVVFGGEMEENKKVFEEKIKFNVEQNAT